jgi:hypothetical protein
VLEVALVSVGGGVSECWWWRYRWVKAKRPKVQYSMSTVGVQYSISTVQYEYTQYEYTV